MVDLSLDVGIDEGVARASAGRCCILIAGASGAGKTTTATLLAARLGCAVLELDRFYRDRIDVPTVEIDGEPLTQWDCPEAFDIGLASACLQEVMNLRKSTVRIPRYSFEIDARVGMELMRIPSTEHLIVDGTLAHLLVRGCAAAGVPAVTVYVHAAREERVRRIRERDRLKPRRTPEPDMVFAARMSAMASTEHLWISPQRDHADIVIRAEAALTSEPSRDKEHR